MGYRYPGSVAVPAMATGGWAVMVSACACGDIAGVVEPGAARDDAASLALKQAVRCRFMTAAPSVVAGTVMSAGSRETGYRVGQGCPQRGI